MMITLAEIAEASLEPTEAVQVEGWLDGQWRQLHPTETFAVRMPFWFEAVIGQAQTRGDVVSIVLDYREKARRFRERRADLEMALANRDLRSATRLATTLRGDAAELTKGVVTPQKAAVEVLDVGMRAFLPLPIGPKAALSAISAAVGQDRASSLSIRLFHPEIRAIYDLGRHASRLGNAIPRAFTLFGLPKADARKPLRFLNRLGDVSTLG